MEADKTELQLVRWMGDRQMRRLSTKGQGGHLLSRQQLSCPLVNRGNGHSRLRSLVFPSRVMQVRVDNGGVPQNPKADFHIPRLFI